MWAMGDKVGRDPVHVREVRGSSMEKVSSLNECYPRNPFQSSHLPTLACTAWKPDSKSLNVGSCKRGRITSKKTCPSTYTEFGIKLYQINTPEAQHSHQWYWYILIDDLGRPEDGLLAGPRALSWTQGHRWGHLQWLVVVCSLCCNALLLSPCKTQLWLNKRKIISWARKKVGPGH